MTRVLLTGATGVLGSELLTSLRARPGVELVAISRRGDPGRGVLRWRLGAEPPPEGLGRRFDAVVHAAASTRWNQEPEEAWEANVRSTEAVLDVAADAHLVHISTAFAIGLRGDTSSDRPADYRNSYEWSKAAAERLVARHGRCTVIRPPLIIGRRADGRVARFSGLYTFARAALSGLAPALVGEPKGTVEMVAVDDVATAVNAALEAGPPAGAAPIVLGAGPRALSTEDLVDVSYRALNGWRARNGASRLAPPPIISTERWERFFLPFARTTLTGRQLRVIELLSEFVPYMSMADPPKPTMIVPPVHEILGRAFTFWAESNPRAALAEPRPWAA
ncbi:SDR family oxidoreductase [Spirillospora sp. NPDC047279]|uniref:SDR family oxidoreductase n=1 Tax=Spirillospora sp. NPDC047279 TaxID=3155478 RepID=UPI0033C7C590